LECCSVTPDGLYVQRNNLKGKVQVVGFDTNPSTLQLIKDGYIDASIYQDPYTQGYDAVKLLNDFVQGKTIQNVDTGAVIVDNTNVDQFLAQITTTPSTPPPTTVTPTP
jgi:ABC-type sugar transport system substrate-binding protein